MFDEIMELLQDMNQQMNSDFNELKQCYMDMNDSIQRSIDNIDDILRHINERC